jgi:hypothetical protein
MRRVSRRRLAAFVLVALGSIPSLQTAHASERAPRQAVVIVPPELAEATRHELEGIPNVTVRVLAELPPGPSSREIVEAARTSYTAMEFDAALTAARQAVVALEERATSRADFARLADAWLLRGMAELALGDRNKAMAAFRQAVIILPARELQEGQYPPPVRALYAEVRSTIQNEEPASLTVTPTPAHARLFLDGVEVGVGPTTLRGTAGRHQLRLEALGSSTRRLMVELEATGAAPIAIEMPRAEQEEAMRQLHDLDAEVDAGRAQRLMLAIGGDLAIAVEPAANGSVTYAAADFYGTSRGRAPSAKAALFGIAPDFDPDDLGDTTAAVGTTGPTTEPLHQGFYLRVWAGPALRGDTATLGAVSADSAIPAGDFEVGAGGAIVPGLLVGGSFFFSVGGDQLDVTCPSTVMDPGCNTATPQSRFVAGLKIWADWYPFVSGFHFGGGVGLTRMKLDDGFALLPDTTAIGAMVDLYAGYDFWVTDWATLGAALRIAGWRAQKEEVVLSGGALSLLVTFAYD